MAEKLSMLWVINKNRALISMTESSKLIQYTVIQKHTIVSNGIAFINALPILGLEGWDLQVIK